MLEIKRCLKEIIIGALAGVFLVVLMIWAEKHQKKGIDEDKKETPQEQSDR